MGLTRNGWASGAPLAFMGIGLAALSRKPQGSIENARAFGAKVSYPQGYNDITALKMPVNTSAAGAWRADVLSDLILTAAIGQQGDLTFVALSDLSMTANTRVTSSITFPGETALSMSAAQSMQMNLPLDILARPSTFDIAQEIWNSKRSDYQGAGTLAKVLSDSEKSASLSAALSA